MSDVFLRRIKIHLRVPDAWCCRDRYWVIVPVQIASEGNQWTIQRIVHRHTTSPPQLSVDLPIPSRSTNDSLSHTFHLAVSLVRHLFSKVGRSSKMMNWIMCLLTWLDVEMSLCGTPFEHDSHILFACKCIYVQ